MSVIFVNLTFVIQTPVYNGHNCLPHGCLVYNCFRAHFFFSTYFACFFRHCGIRDPSWSELHHFVSFLNKQLQDFEVSDFCGMAAVEDLPGFAQFVLRFLIQMSRVSV